VFFLWLIVMVCFKFDLAAGHVCLAMTSCFIAMVCLAWWSLVVFCWWPEHKYLPGWPGMHALSAEETLMKC
jgi:type IV secretory pathway TraG/TraD family ATPase VirD4